MTKGWTRRTVQAFSYHGHFVKEGRHVQDYSALFSQIATVPAERRVRNLADERRAIGLTRVTKAEEQVVLAVVEGPTEEIQLFLNLKTGTEEFHARDPDRIAGQYTRVVIDLPSRIALVELNRRGAAPEDVTQLLESIYLENFGQRISFQFAALPAPSFVEALGSLERISSVSVTLTKPNADWTDEYNAIMNSAADSDAQTIKIDVAPPRGGTLAKDRGIVKMLVELAKSAVSSIKKAKVLGRRPGEKLERPVQLEQYSIRHNYSVPTNDGRVSEDALLTEMRADVVQIAKERNAATTPPGETLAPSFNIPIANPPYEPLVDLPSKKELLEKPEQILKQLLQAPKKKPGGSNDQGGSPVSG